MVGPIRKSFEQISHMMKNYKGLKITQKSQNPCSKIHGCVFFEVAQAPQAST